MTPYSDFADLLFDRPAAGVLRVTLNRPDKLNALNARLHSEILSVWETIENDDETRVTILTGAGRGFCAGGDLGEMPVGLPDDVNRRFSHDFRHAQALVQAITGHRKPVVSAINGPALGAGLAIALLADVSIAAEEALLLDGHLRIGVAPGDHAVLLWPLLCGLAKAKYFLFANERLTGAQAERCNLVSLAVPAAELADRAVEVASRIAAMAPTAIAMTKYALNQWLRQNQHVFDLAAAFEMVNFRGEEAAEAMRAQAERRPAVFPLPSAF